MRVEYRFATHAHMEPILDKHRISYSVSHCNPWRNGRFPPSSTPTMYIPRRCVSLVVWQKRLRQWSGKLIYVHISKQTAVY
jgi:hypothetical protein